jgi:hypothetical protein
MKTINNTSFCLASTLLTFALAGPLAAEKQVSFRGTLQGQEIDTLQGGPPPTTLSVNGTVTGIATHLGRFTYKYQVTVNIAAGSPTAGSATGTGQMIAANGDIIFFTIAGQGVPTDTPGVTSIVEMNTITGGTGRFQGVTGSLIIERLVEMATGITSGSFHGMMSTPGSAH